MAMRVKNIFKIATMAFFEHQSGRTAFELKAQQLLKKQQEGLDPAEEKIRLDKRFDEMI